MSKIESLIIDEKWGASVFSHEPTSVAASEAAKILVEQSASDIQNSEQELT